VLGAYVEQDKETIAAVAGQEAVAWAEATHTLKWRGFLQAVDRGVLVTPEGLGCFLGEVGVEVDGRAWSLERHLDLRAWLDRMLPLAPEA
jgi:hypothetical protein